MAFYEFPDGFTNFFGADSTPQTGFEEAFSTSSTMYDVTMAAILEGSGTQTDQQTLNSTQHTNLHHSVSGEGGNMPSPSQSDAAKEAMLRQYRESKREQKKLNRSVMRLQKEHDPLLDSALAAFSLSSNSSTTPFSSTTNPSGSNTSITPGVKTTGGFYNIKGKFVPARAKTVQKSGVKKNTLTGQRGLTKKQRKEATGWVQSLPRSERADTLIGMRRELGLPALDMSGGVDFNYVKEHLIHAYVPWTTMKKKQEIAGATSAETSGMVEEGKTKASMQWSEGTGLMINGEDSEMVL